MADELVVNEIYLSLQGESTFAGLPCVFVRLSACNLRCSYCDTAYAFTEGRKWSLDDIRRRVHELAAPYGAGGKGQGSGVRAQEAGVRGQEVEGVQGGLSGAGVGAAAQGPEHASTVARLPLVEFTGGEPLLQP